MKIKDVINFLEQLAPPSLQESYDNAGLIVGDHQANCNGVITCLDSTEAVVEEAIEKGCNLIVAHHPIVFAGLKTITGKNYIERTLIKAIKHDIAIYAIHTNLDNVKYGVNGVWANALGLKNQQVLSPKSGLLSKLVVFVPKENKEDVLKAIFSAGGGEIAEYSECSYSTEGEGTFKPSEKANPYSGKSGERSHEKEDKIEVLVPNYAISSCVSSAKEAHPYEEMAYDVIPLSNSHQEIGAGMVGELEHAVDALDWLKSMKGMMEAGVVRYTNLCRDKIKRVAICGGSGSFLLNAAIRSGADVFVTADFKYHQFFDADNKIIIADIGHYESEQLTINYLADRLKEKFTTFAVLLTEVNTNPINYL
ncbi:Nif3-like dinuclear metal center hexameric protein [Parvicella tangerina]|uniref:GTP cyclohydrolase 1 type 2 homolog n=1 Tax=Parvicella tangerina TaxID=2829795 RepID=A0A916NHR6_9FLAO|nr:Nif3-like dinuclear metal center hexameric protein [Parvicella tangerina]CAG5083543.1 GTP cyclohydrolase 1 type 2 [Parvicella tangerina]